MKFIDRSIIAALLLIPGGVGMISGSAWAASSDTMIVEIDRHGRRIMLDGFLMEWSMESSRPWGDTVSGPADNTQWRWDAMLTSEGLAGYVRTGSRPDSGWTFTFSGPAFSTPQTVTLPIDSIWKSDYMRIDRAEHDMSAPFAIEWLFPLPHDTDSVHGADRFSLAISAVSPRGDTMSVMLLRTDSSRVASGKSKGGLALRGVLIVILAVMYLMVQRTIQRQGRRREPLIPPHRE